MKKFLLLVVGGFIVEVILFCLFPSLIDIVSEIIRWGFVGVCAYGFLLMIINAFAKDMPIDPWFLFGIGRDVVFFSLPILLAASVAERILPLFKG